MLCTVRYVLHNFDGNPAMDSQHLKNSHVVGVLTFKIDGLSHWVSSVGWQKYLQPGPNELHLRIYHDILLITNFDKVVESLNTVTYKMKGFLKGDLLILAVCDKNKAIRKIKFQLLCSPEEIAACVGKLVSFFPVEDRNAKRFINRTHKFNTVEDALKMIMDGGNEEVLQQMPPSYPELVRMCLLDPAFPQLVRETESVLKTILP